MVAVAYGAPPEAITGIECVAGTNVCVVDVRPENAFVVAGIHEVEEIAVVMRGISCSPRITDQTVMEDGTAAIPITEAVDGKDDRLGFVRICVRTRSKQICPRPGRLWGVGVFRGVAVRLFPFFLLIL